MFCLAMNSEFLVSGAFDGSIGIFDRGDNFALVKRIGKEENWHRDMIYGLAINCNNIIARYSSLIYL